MARFDFDITTLFRDAFGVGRGKPYDSSKVIVPGITEGGEYPDVPEAATEEGTEFVNMRQQVQARTPDGRALFMPMRLGGLLLPNEPTVRLSGRKFIVETGLVGSVRKGSVKELIRTEDWDVVIRGVAVNYASHNIYPEDEIKNIRDLIERNEALKIECALTSLMGIYRVVIKDFDFPEMIAVQHAQAYELRCVSDEDFVLEIN